MAHLGNSEYWQLTQRRRQYLAYAFCSCALLSPEGGTLTAGGNAYVALRAEKRNFTTHASG